MIDTKKCQLSERESGVALVAVLAKMTLAEQNRCMGIPVIMYDAESTGAKNYLALADEIIKRNK